MSIVCRAFRITCLSALALAQDWPAFRGPNSSGLSPTAARLPERFDASTERWNVRVPFGRSSPIVIGKQVILTALHQDQLCVIALDTETGRERWRYRQPRSRQNEIDGKRNDPASSTPAADSSGVYAFFQDFGLVALDIRGGALRWKVPLGPFLNNYGVAASPVLSGESVLLQVDQIRESYLVAMHRRTGTVRWKRPRAASIEGWSTPILTPRGEVVTLSSNGLEAFSSETGDPLWLVPAPDSIMIPVPLLHGAGRIIATMRGAPKATFPDWPSTLAELDANGDGKIEPPEIVKRYAIENFGIADPDRDGFITEAEWNRFIRRGVGDFGFTSIDLAGRRINWRHQRSLPYVPSPVVYRDVLYSVRSGGFLLALDANSGAVLKEDRLPDAGGEYLASLVAGDGKLYAFSGEGKVTVIRAAGKDWNVLGSASLDEALAATPAIGADGTMFIRTSQSLRAHRHAVR